MNPCCLRLQDTDAQLSKISQCPYTGCISFALNLVKLSDMQANKDKLMELQKKLRLDHTYQLHNGDCTIVLDCRCVESTSHVACRDRHVVGYQ